MALYFLCFSNLSEKPTNKYVSHMHLNIALFTHFDKHSERSHMTLSMAILFHTSGSGLRTGVLVDPVSTCLPGPWREYEMVYFSTRGKVYGHVSRSCCSGSLLHYSG